MSENTRQNRTSSVTSAAHAQTHSTDLAAAIALRRARLTEAYSLGAANDFERLPVLSSDVVFEWLRKARGVPNDVAHSLAAPVASKATAQRSVWHDEADADLVRRVGKDLMAELASDL